jgi:trehalose 6-phosphate phosphatase
VSRQLEQEDKRPLMAAVFDLDGVVTRTARLHIASWTQLFNDYLRSRAKRADESFRPFDPGADYRAYVDGRPRYAGVHAFLASRGIHIPAGMPEDGPDVETEAGLGNRKNVLFQQQLEREGVEVDGAAVALIHALRARGVRVGVASSSRNTELVLRRAGLLDLFEARVDGVLSARLGLRGKPHADIFLECLKLLGGAHPRHAVVLEDAAAGVRAGKAGGFGLVLGVDRGGNWMRLREAGADWIVQELAEVSPERIEGYLSARAHVRPNALFEWPALKDRLAGRPLAVFLDYDGTLTPIVSRPDQALLSERMRQTLRRLSAVWPTQILSGRGLEDVRSLVGIDSIGYAGSHGFDIAGSRDAPLRHEVEPGLASEVHRAAQVLRDRAAGIPGALVEDKRFSVAVHYRLVPEERVPELERLVDEVLARSPRLKKAHGKKVFELRPAIAWDKGKALRWLQEATGLQVAIPLYIGDDTTDEDAFEAVAGRGLGILVTELPRPTAASHSLQNTEEVRELLERLCSLAREMPP